MNNRVAGRTGKQPSSTRSTHDLHDNRDEAVPTHLYGLRKDRVYNETTPNNAARRQMSRRSSKSYSARVSREKSPKRQLFERQGITLDTSVARHKGREPHLAFPDNESKSSSFKKQSWFSAGRTSTKTQGLGITRGTPQPAHLHRANPSLDQSDAPTAISLTPGSKKWDEISPWDRRIPIGISVPTESISDFSSYNGGRARSGSDATLVTPSIVVTPAEAMKSVWSPDTPFTDSDYTPSIYSRYGHNAQSTDPTAPPVPALPSGIADSSGIRESNKEHHRPENASGHGRKDTLDSNGTAFEEDEEVKQGYRVMSSGTLFEEDETPLRERSVEATMAIDESLVPTPRRSQGWWNVITTPFVTTPNTAVFPQNGQSRFDTPAVPNFPTAYDRSDEESSAATRNAAQKNSLAQPEAHVTNVNTAFMASGLPAQTTKCTRDITSPTSAMSASPVISTAAIGTILMPRQVEEQPRTININIELQDRRPNMASQNVRANALPATEPSHTSPPASHANVTATMATKTNASPQNFPVFAPPPTHAAKSHFSYDKASRSSSPSSTHELKGKGQKKRRKVCDMTNLFSFARRGKQKRTDERKKKKKGLCFWGCCCCLVFLVFLAVIIPLTVVLTNKGKDEPAGTPVASGTPIAPGTPAGTQPDQGGNSGWLNLPNYPPIPTGISTVAQPEVVDEESGCVAPTTIWSCALPKELQDSVKPNKPDQPNFSFQIEYDNSTKGTQTLKRAANPVSAASFIRSHLLRKRALPSPSPAPPDDADRTFLGKTTDSNSAPFGGESTPLYITFQDLKKPSSRLLKRIGPDDPTNFTGVIPPPSLEADGSAAAANLLTFPSAQPLRLYNRGKENEHYGFYSYFDRSIFLKQINGTNRGGNPADVNGGSLKSAATMRCTYAETRFLVQIWTRSQTSKPLLQRSTPGTDPLKRPGTFPYPVTLTLDRHGGNPRRKMVYCYSMESDGTILNKDSSKFFQFEDLGFGGNLINGTQGRPDATGPIDGGTGGCRCQWQNWLN